MGRKKLDIMSREAFSQLSLYEKNAYLQELATQFAAQHDWEPVELDKVVLSQLRRYYSRRVWSDLKLDTLPDPPLNRHLRALGEAIRSESIEADVAAVLMQETRSKHMMRAPPVDDAQTGWFFGKCASIAAQASSVNPNSLLVHASSCFRFRKPIS